MSPFYGWGNRHWAVKQHGEGHIASKWQTKKGEAFYELLLIYKWPRYNSKWFAEHVKIQPHVYLLLEHTAEKFVSKIKDIFFELKSMFY